MSRALITLALIVATGSLAARFAVGAAVGRTADARPHLVEAASPAFALRAITIL